MAEETDAARDRVLAARASLAEELEALEASIRAAVDVPAKIRRSPAKAAAIAGGSAFLVLGGPKRLFGLGKRAVKGPPPALPQSLLPDEIEKTLRKLGHDGDNVRGTLERDFALYAKAANKDRTGLQSVLLLTVARPILQAAMKAAMGWFLRTDEAGFQARLAQIRERTNRDPGGEEADVPQADVMDRAHANVGARGDGDDAHEALGDSAGA
ncbi:MAG: hypothetical protein ABJC39_01720 [Chloroflexota bacterium]